jgi:uncharacterized RDD family membrane protein YckC
VDGIVLIPVGVSLQLLLGISFDPSVSVGMTLLLLAVTQFLSVMTHLVYEGIMVGRYGATIGKMACGIRVVMPDGQKVSYLRAFARFLAKQVSLFTLGIGYILAAFDKQKRGLHDLICNTRVVYKPIAPPVPNRCPRCQSSVMEPTQTGAMRCGQCATSFQVEVFPALFHRPQTEREAELILVEGESSCFYHVDKRALLPCHGCGRFLCALCDCELNREHFCPSCLEAGAARGKISRLEKRRTKHDSIALSLAVLPMITIYLTLITAPAALYISIRHWNSPRSIVPRTRIRFVIAIVLALLQIMGWVLLIFVVARYISGRANL